MKIVESANGYIVVNDPSEHELTTVAKVFIVAQILNSKIREIGKSLSLITDMRIRETLEDEKASCLWCLDILKEKLEEKQND